MRKTKRKRRYSYSEDVNEAPAIVEKEPVDLESATPADANVPVERIEPEEADAALAAEE